MTRTTTGSGLARVALAVLVVGCAVEPRPVVEGRAVLPIVNGERELGEDAVVLVQGVIGVCTGTLITDRVVLTAKHCVQSRGMESPAPPSFFAIGVGNRSGATTPHRVREIITTPGGFFGSAIVDGSDIALMVLRAPIEGVTPIAVRREAPTDLIGRDVTAIGFGQTPAGESGIKYRTTTTIDDVTPTVLTGVQAICQGDSGGPIILESDGTRPREIVGVASYGQTMAGGPSCPAVLDAWNRVDLLFDLIDRAILVSGGCAARGDETCNSLDDDCDGTVDEGCAALGEACETDADCALSALPELLREGAPPAVVCAEIDGARRCALPCDVLAPAASCSAITIPFRGETLPVDGFYCAGTGGCEGLCVAGMAGARDNAEPCTADTECASLFCSDVGVCATPCLGDAVSCPASEVCTADAGACGLCANPASRPAGRGRGEPCEDPSQCASGGCGTLDGARICTLACVGDGDCGPAMRCESGACARGARSETFETCRATTDCISGACLDRDGHGFCAPTCTDAASCLGTCTPMGDTMRCIPGEPVLGEACTDACAEGVCEAGVCTARCGGASACPVGHDCVREGTETVCRPRPASGGCSASAGARGLGVVPALALAALLLLGRRRRAGRR
jgi:V8-like Glu-specific endopeptidase